MTPEQALQLLSTMTQKIQADLQTHQAILRALQVLQEAITKQTTKNA